MSDRRQRSWQRTDMRPLAFSTSWVAQLIDDSAGELPRYCYTHQEWVTTEEQLAGHAGCSVH